LVKLHAKLIDLDGVANDRDQLWAEAAFAEAEGEPLMISADLWSAASIQQQARVTHDPWEDLIRRKLAELREDKANNGAYCVGINDDGGREWRVASSYLLGMDVLHIQFERQTNAVTKRLAEVMRTLGWTKPPQTIRVGNVPCRGFTKPIDEPKSALQAIEDESNAAKAIAAPDPPAAPPKLVLIRRRVVT
jgi:predicted P-loop ATPase